MADQNNPHFKELFWFAVSIEFLGLLFLSALIWAPVPKENQTMATATFGFLTATVIAVPLSYLLGGNPTQSKQKDTTILPTSTIDTVNIDNTNNPDKTETK